MAITLPLNGVEEQPATVMTIAHLIWYIISQIMLHTITSLAQQQ